MKKVDEFISLVWQMREAQLNRGAHILSGQLDAAALEKSVDDMISEYAGELQAERACSHSLKCSKACGSCNRYRKGGEGRTKRPGGWGRIEMPG